MLEKQSLPYEARRKVQRRHNLLTLLIPGPGQVHRRDDVGGEEEDIGISEVFAWTQPV